VRRRSARRRRLSENGTGHVPAAFGVDEEKASCGRSAVVRTGGADLLDDDRDGLAGPERFA